MSDTQHRNVARKFEDFFGGPRLATTGTAVVLALAAVIALGWAGVSAFVCAAVFTGVQAILVTGWVAIRSGGSNALRVGLAGLGGLIVLFAFGATGVFTFAEQNVWSGLSGVLGIVTTTLLLGVSLSRQNHGIQSQQR
ncbi:hypothetical protein [Actinopolyspora mortivallis]|uniref:hypothetical protein n=1 Tax=Actinopolyspora mortivallis TaxID=33906 RepID=UPI001FE1647A|nr:hypothetical protein [Actinopolyspora mortivallis]